MTRVWKRIVVKRMPFFHNGERKVSESIHTRATDGAMPRSVREIRIAIYEDELSPPRIECVREVDVSLLLRESAAKAHEIAKTMGSLLPRLLFSELIDNLIHTGFKGAFVSLRCNGNNLSISDLGPGISDPEKALRFGYTTAAGWMLSYIRGIGAGLPLVNEVITKMKGTLRIDANISGGTVVTVTLPQDATAQIQDGLSGSQPQREMFVRSAADQVKGDIEPIGLSDREKHVLLLLAELDSAGPSRVARELGISLSTAHRDMAKLERYSLLRSLRNGKKKVTEEGLGQLELIFSSTEPPSMRKASRPLRE